MVKTIRFFGIPTSLTEWRNVLLNQLLVEATPVQTANNRFFVDCELNEEQRASLMGLWRSGWNLKLSFEER